MPLRSLHFSAIYSTMDMFCGCGEIGRRAGLRIRWATLQVQVLSSAPKNGARLRPFTLRGRVCAFLLYGARLRPFTLRGRVCVLLLCGGARLRPFTLRGAFAPFLLRRQIFFAQSRPKNFLAQIRPIFCGLRNNRNFCRLRNNRIFLARKRAGQDVRLSFY